MEGEGVQKQLHQALGPVLDAVHKENPSAVSLRPPYVFFLVSRNSPSAPAACRASTAWARACSGYGGKQA